MLKACWKHFTVGSLKSFLKNGENDIWASNLLVQLSKRPFAESSPNML